jgi:thiamine biosynthesis lipoprotein
MSAVAVAERTSRFSLWGGEATVAVADGDRFDAALEAVQAVIEAFDRACSPFRGDSELAAINRASGMPVDVSPLCADALAAAIDAAELTGGIVDPTVGAASLALEPLPVPGLRVRARLLPGWQAIEFDAGRRRVRIPRGAQLDLGATAKALATDRAAEQAATAAGCGALVSLLGDLAIAGPAPEAGWRVRVTDDHRSGPGIPGQTIVLHHGGLATSSRTVRRALDDPARHHLLDPRTGRPADGPWRTASVHAATCLEANAVSTALLVAGGTAQRLLDASELPARLVGDNGAIQHLHGWPPDGEEGS